MAEQDGILINVAFEGAATASRAIDTVTAGMSSFVEWGNQAAEQTREVETNFGRLTSSGLNVAQRIQGVAGAAQQLVSAFGSNDRTAGLVASVAGSVAQFGALGAMLGPAGAVVGGVAGLAAGIAGLVTAENAAAEASAALAGRINDVEQAADTADDRIARLNRTLARTAELSRIDLGVASDSAYAEESIRLSSELATAEERLAALHAGGVFGSGAERRFGAAGRLFNETDAEARRLRARLEEINALRASAASEEADVLMEDLLASGGAGARSGGGGADGGLTVVDMNERYREESARILSARLAETARVNDEELTIELDRIATLEAAERAAEDARRSMMEDRIAETQRINEEELDAELARMDAVEAREAEGRQAMKDAQTAMLEQQQEEREQAAGELTNLLGQTTAALGKAVGSIILGEKTTEEAFKGLAAAFLEMVSQYASLKAATEFADAAASFARYDFGGGAAHIGAGLAFTAVAVATGVGAAAINAPPQAPARPEAGQQPTDSGGGGDVVVNFNSPIVTAITRAELGRNISGLVAEAGSI